MNGKFNGIKNFPQSTGDRPKPEYSLVETITVGSVVLEITLAAGDRGPLYSILPNTSRGERKSKFFRPNDMDDLSKASTEAKLWIEADRHERQSKTPDRKRA